LIQRLITGGVLLFYALIHLKEASESALFILYLLAAAGGLLLVIGLWTPVAGAVIAVLELWIAFARTGDSLASILLATLGGTLAIIGPGAWSIDARLFGRKHLIIDDR
jgi:putative oxidoreductase